MTKIITIALLLCLISVPACATMYPAVCVVVDFDYKENLVIIEDYNGNLWAFEGIEDWILGDIVGLIMDDMNTQLIEDDKIIRAEYCGHLFCENVLTF